MKRIALALALPTLVALGACNSDNTTSPGADFQLTAADTLEAVVSSAAVASAADVDVLNSVETSLVGWGATGSSADFASLAAFAGPSSWGSATNCTWNTTTLRLDCATVTSGGLSLTRSFAFYDGSGQAQMAFNHLTTDSVNVHATESGVHTVATGADTVSRDRNMTVSGLLGTNTTRTWNGTGSRTEGWWRNNVSGAKRTAHTTGTSTFTNVVVTLPRSTHPWPTSGTLVRQASGTGTVTKNNRTKTITFSKQVTITFNGTANATLTVDSKTWTVNLSTGTATEN